MDNRVLQIVLQARDDASKTLKNVGDQAEKTGQSIKTKLTNNTAELGVAFAATTAIIVSSISAYAASEDASAQLEAVLKSTKSAAGVTADEVLRLSSALQQQSKFEDEAITGAQNMLLTFTNIGKGVFPQATQAVLDMSQALGQDLKASSMQLGKALNDPIAGVTALRKVGVNLTEDTREQIKTLVESGKTMEAQKIILNELSTEFGGSAKAAASKFNGQLVIIKNNLGDTQEIIGQGLLSALNSLPGGLDSVNNAILNMNKFLTENKGVLLGLTFGLLAVAATMGGLFLAALVVTAGTAGIWVAAVGGAVAVVGFLAGMVIANWTPISGFFSNLWGQISNTFTNFTSNFSAGVSGLITNAITWFQKLPGTISGFFLDLFSVKIPYAVGYAAGWLSTAIPAMIANIGNWFASLPSTVGTIFNNVRVNIITAISAAITWLGFELSALPGRVSGWISSLPGIVTGIFARTKDGAVSKMSELLSSISGIWDRIRGIFDAIMGAAGRAADSVSKGFSAGSKVGVRAYADGGWVPNTGPAILHSGEYVLSRAMLEGRQPIEAPINNNQKSVNIGQVIVQSVNDMDSLVRRISNEYSFNSAI